jgi:transposase
MAYGIHRWRLHGFPSQLAELVDWCPESELTKAGDASQNFVSSRACRDNAGVDPSQTAASGGGPRHKPQRMIANKAYDNDPLRKRLRGRGIEMICPHKRNRTRPATQDGRALRRYGRRWVIERTFGWLGNFRRLATGIAKPSVRRS